MAEERVNQPMAIWRLLLCLTVIVAAYLLLLTRSWLWQADSGERMSNLGEQYHIREHQLISGRGIIVDRNGQPIAVSSKVYSVGIHPEEFEIENEPAISKIAKILAEDPTKIRQEFERRRQDAFFYLRRHVSPARKRALAELKLTGMVFTPEFKRFYPDREIFANVIGFTNVDGVGQEGLELAFDEWLSGHNGKQRILRDNNKKVIDDLGVIEQLESGRNLHLALDRRLQHYAYDQLQRVLTEQQALSGSLVILDALNGEILAMVNLPSFNPNNRADYNSAGTKVAMRNKAVIDTFEPGSTIKPLTIAAALKTGQFDLHSKLDIGAGKMLVDGFEINDVSTKGVITLSEVLKYSSNVGASKVALQIGADVLRGTLSDFGFGHITHSGFPGESAGVLNTHKNWPDSVLATMSYGYGLSVSLLQLARAYAILADDGLAKSVSFQLTHDRVKKHRVIDAETAQKILSVLGEIVRDGTGRAGQISGYSVGGKTGTTRKNLATGGYSADRYHSMFVGISPLAKPRLVCAIVIDEPQKQYYGGQVAAPLFSKVMSVALRLMGIGADRIDVADVSL